MNKFLIVLFALICGVVNAQNLENLAKEIKNEGIELYRSEMASWYGTDVFRANYKKMENVGGYFSYVDEAVPKCIFFSKNNKVIATIAFPTNYNPNDAKLDLNERDFTARESEYLAIRQNALERINNDTIFKRYNNTSLNLVPIIRNNTKKVYVLTGPSVNNVVVFGNDYLINFDNQNKIKNIEKLHKGIIVQNINDEKVGKTVGGIHTHILEDWLTITPTDICTLMLYQKFTDWENYTIVSKKYVSIWDGKSNNLIIMKEKDFKKMDEKISENKEEKNKTRNDTK